MQKPEKSGSAYWNDFAILYKEVVKYTAPPSDAVL
jgi:hypothetical protein